VGTALIEVPIVQVFDVGDGVEPAGFGFEEIGVFGEEAGGYDAAWVVLFF